MEKKLKEIREREEELKKYLDYDKRIGLFKSWIGQADKCIRKGNLQDPYYFSLCNEWLKKCESLLDGNLIEKAKGKVKVKGESPMSKKQRIAWKQDKKKELRKYRKKLQDKNYARQKKTYLTIK